MKIDCSIKKASIVLTELEKEGYLQLTHEGTRKKKMFNFIGQRDKAIEQYFNPCTGIEQFASHLHFTKLILADQSKVIDPLASPIQNETQFKVPDTRGARQKAGNKSERAKEQPRIFRAPNHVVAIDDASTQGTPSPHSKPALRPDSPTPITPVTDRTRVFEPTTDHGKKRKADEKPEAKPARRARVAHGTPWSLRYYWTLQLCRSCKLLLISRYSDHFSSMSTKFCLPVYEEY